MITKFLMASFLLFLTLSAQASMIESSSISVPEPATPLLLGIGLLALGLCRRRVKS